MENKETFLTFLFPFLPFFGEKIYFSFIAENREEYISAYSVYSGQCYRLLDEISTCGEANDVFFFSFSLAKLRFFSASKQTKTEAPFFEHN